KSLRFGILSSSIADPSSKILLQTRFANVALASSSARSLLGRSDFQLSGYHRLPRKRIRSVVYRRQRFVARRTDEVDTASGAEYAHQMASWQVTPGNPSRQANRDART